jgi:predicted dithiol-disulfide oxidoreductase (DUF899 family)
MRRARPSARPINAEGRALPWVKVEKNYLFHTSKGKKNLSESFADRSRLIVYHFMLGPGWGAGCPGCSFLSDHIDGALPHLEHHDVTLTAVSRAPLIEIEAYKKRMGRRFPWVSAFGTDFNYDYHVSFADDDLKKGTVLSYTTSPKLLCMRDRRARNCRVSVRSTKTTQAKSFTPIRATPAVVRS